MAPSVEEQVEKLSLFLSNYLETGPAPILWVGAGASAAAGYPTLGKLEEILRKKLPGAKADGYQLVDAYVDEYSRADLARLLQQHLGKPLPFAPVHEAIARLAGAGVFPHLFTTNYDRLLEDALSEADIPFVPQSLEANYILQEMDQVQLLKMHGDQGDWLSVVLTTWSYEEFEKTYPLLKSQLNQSLRTHPVVFVGCSMTDPRLLDWLKGLTPAERSNLFASRAILTEKAWARLSQETQKLLGEANLKPILVEDNAAVTRLLQELAVKLAPLSVGMELVFEIDPKAGQWVVTGPTPESPPHMPSDPLAYPELADLLGALKDSVSVVVPLDAPDAPAMEAALNALGLRIAERLTPVLLSEAARQEVVRRMNQLDRGRARLVIRVGDGGSRGDQALALPWELIAPEPGRFAVKEGKLDVVREAVVDGAPILPEPTGPLRMAAVIAAPEDQSRLSYEKESFRLQGALTPLGQQVAFADLGGVDDLVEVVAGQKAFAVHFSGHGLPGHLVFEDDYGLSQKVPIEEVLRKLRVELAGEGQFPRLFFLASCYGASGGSKPAPVPAETATATREPRSDLAAALGEGPSTVASLHRNGFVQVIGYFGPVGDELCTRAEEAFYGALAEGKTTLHAAAEARATLTEPLKLDGQRLRYPLGWAQLAVYHRGPDRPLAQPGTGRGKLNEPFRRREVEVSGLPVLEHGFIGRRGLQHEIRRLVEKDGRKLIVLQGLGGLGKTALASQLLSRTFAPANRDQLILRCRSLDERTDPIAELRAQAEKHGEDHKLPRWEERVKKLREEIADPVQGFAAAIAELRTNCPDLVLYADNAETLQDGPKDDESKDLGSWKPEAMEWWTEMERLSQDGLVLVSTRYGWKGLDPRSWITVDPMSPADVLRMLDTFEGFDLLDREARERLAKKVDGHPRTLEILDRLIRGRLADQGPGFEVRDAWADLVEPVLPEQEQRIRADLLLEKLWERLSSAGREHAIRLGVLRVPAPKFVVDKLGTATVELIRSCVLTRFREQILSEEGLEWIDQWGLHSLVRAFVELKTEDVSRRSAHLAAGKAFEEWVKGEGARWSEQEEGIHHFHVVGEGNRAWPMVREYVLWLRGQARYREALALLEACEIAGTSEEPLANALMFMAQMRRQLGERSSDLSKILDRAMNLSNSDAVRSDILYEYGLLRDDRGEYVEAEDLLRQALDLSKKVYGESHADYATALHGVAEVLSSQGKFKEAEDLLRRSIEVEDSLSLSPYEKGASLHSLASVLFNQGKNEEAESLLRQSLELKERSLGLSHPSLCSTLTNLAGVLAGQKRPEEGEPFLQRALEIAIRVHGPSHPDVAQILNMLAQLQVVLGRPEATQTARQAMEALEATLGADHPRTRAVTPILQKIAGVAGAADPVSQLVSQARAAAQQQDLPAAISAQEQVVELVRSAGEKREVLVALSAQLFNLAGYYSNAGRYEDAVKALEEVVALDERTAHPDLESDRQALEEARRMAELSPEQRERREAMLSVVRQIETLADQARDGAIEALRGETEREALIARIEEVAVKAAEGEEDGSPWADLAVYLRGVAAFLRGEPVPAVPAVFAERMEAIEAAAKGYGASTS